MKGYEWTERLPECAVTVSDTECTVLYQNELSVKVNGDMTGRNMLPCHNERSRQIIARLLEGDINTYTIDKGDIHKMIYQTPWYTPEGIVGGLVELSMQIPRQMPNYVRK